MDSLPSTSVPRRRIIIGCCGSCNEEVTTRHKSITCQLCTQLYHSAASRKCVQLGMENNISGWTCGICVAGIQQASSLPASSTTFNQSQDNMLYELPFAEISDLSINNYTDNDVLTGSSNTNAVVYENLLPKGRKIIHLNVNGIRNKYEEIRYFLINESNVMVLAITESKLSKDRDPKNMYTIPGYELFRNDREKKMGGGTLIYINENFNFEICDLPATPPGFVECNVVKLSGNFLKHILVCVMYVPPDKVDEQVFSFIENILCYLRSTNIEFVLLGNVDLLKQSSESSRMISIRKEFNLHQRIELPTRIAVIQKADSSIERTATLIDHLYVSNKDKFSSAGVLNFTTSDHHMIYTTYKCNRVKIPPKVLEYRCFRKMNMRDFTDDFSKIDWDFLTNKSTLQFGAELLEKSVIALMDKHAPLKRKLIKGTNAPWFSSELVSLCKEGRKTKKALDSNPDLLTTYRKLKYEI